ncbi:MAG: DNA polymerase II [candidate division NC10 bacterium]|nr:DNA polymerase II [candidate division NC10 bacterium]
MRLGALSLYENALLFGHDATPHLVAVERTGESEICCYLREGGRLVTRRAPFSPFLLLASTDLLKGYAGAADVEALAGEAPLRYLARVPGWAEALRLRAHLQKGSGKTAAAPDAPFRFFNDPVHQHLLLSGQTHFLGLAFEDLRRLQLDIETYCAPGFEFPNPERETDRITAIALRDSTGWERVLSGREWDEASMLREVSRELQARDPDILEGHNLFRFDLPYLEARARRHAVPLAWGRDGGALAGHPSRLQVAERTITYTKYEIAGRHVVDTWMLANFYDVAARELEGYGLKEVARHFGLTSPDRVTIPAHRASWYFDHDPETLCRYALDDVRETEALAALLSRSYLVQAQIFPYSYQNVVLRGTATKIDALLLREYLRQRQAIPLPGPAQPFAGGYTAVKYVGVARSVLHCDVASLYPSLMLKDGLFPRSDTLGVFPVLLTDLRAFRLEAKAAARAAPTERERQGIEALQATFKVLINSFYGYLGFALGHFNDFDQAKRVAAAGRALIRQIVAWLERRGCQVIEVDTDGLYFMPPPTVGEAEAEALVEELIRTLPAGITLEFDGRYPAMFSYKMKNYALLDEADRLIIRGSGLRSRGLELFQRRWMEEMFRLALTGEREKVPALLERYREAFRRHEFDVEMFMKTETLQESLESYREKVRQKKRNPAAAYELALKAERPYQPGDQISYYVTGRGRKVKVHEHGKLAAEWDPAHPDENVEYYIGKLEELHAKFLPFLQGGGPVAEEAEAAGPEGD